VNLHQRVLKGFRRRFGTNPEFIACAPGRVNLLGEHVDYNDGFVLPVAIDLYTLVAFKRSNGADSTIFALDLVEETTFDRKSVLEKKDVKGVELSDWARYPAGVLWSLNMEGLETHGMDAVFTSDVPRAAGLSSSASIELAFGVAWEILGAWNLTSIHLATLCRKAEVNYVGLNCGIMDQFASACGVKDRILYLDCRSLEYYALGLPVDTDIVIADTSVRRSLTSSSYNDRNTSCQDAVRILQQFLPGIRALRDVSEEQLIRYSYYLPESTRKRVNHVVAEIARTGLAIKFLENNDIAGFGRLMNECHASLRDLYEVSCPELDIMAALAQSLPGCYGARLTGAGFGGCTVNLVASNATVPFSQKLATGYTHATGITPKIYICHATDGARVESAKNQVQSSHE
jgi:galactokinase